MQKRLVPLIVIALAAAIFWWTRQGASSPMHDVDSDVRDCRTNLHAIYDALRAYNAERGTTPPEPGVAFLAALAAGGYLEGSAAERLTCPGSGAHAVPSGTDFAAPDAVDERSSAFAARDVALHPLAKFPSGGREIQALVACDNAHGMNHSGGVMNVLYSDRTVKTLELDQLIESGVLPAGATLIPVGPESPIEELRVLRADPAPSPTGE